RRQRDRVRRALRRVDRTGRNGGRVERGVEVDVLLNTSCADAQLEPIRQLIVDRTVGCLRLVLLIRALIRTRWRPLTKRIANTWNRIGAEARYYGARYARRKTERHRRQ